MSNQNKAKTRDELITESGLKYAIWDNDRRGYVPGHDGVTKEGFIAGAKWADANPPPEVQGLLDALARIKKGDTGDCLVPWIEIQRIASAALETYRKVTSKE